MSDAAQPYSFSLGTFSEPSTFNLLIDITAAEYDEMHEAFTAVAGLSPSFDYKLIARNFVDLESIHQFVTITISLGRQFATPDRRQLGESLMGSMVNWLTSMRLFLDHTETDLKRRYGKMSREVQQFKKATKSAFDTRVGYRFSYKFRNYVQHCGLPLSHIDISRPNRPTRTRAKQSVALLLDRDELLSSYDEWGIVKRDLEAMPPRFALGPLLSEAMEGLRDVYQELLDLRLSEALSRCTVLERALARIEDKGASGHPAIFRYRGEPWRERSQITPTILPAEAIRKLASVAHGSATRESLFKKSEERPPLMFDPATVRERFHRDNRGVQVLSAWLAEKSGTPAFYDTVNTIIAEDQGTEPLITGLINVSGLLAHMTAAAIGATVQGLVAGLLDVYGQFDKPEDVEPTG
jgi:hypothetical protein